MENQHIFLRQLPGHALQMAAIKEEVAGGGVEMCQPAVPR
ncbi:hypothetical protein H4V96_001493 [Janthinobacterium sp. CG_23.4]|nr:hypothetical protein [Janthinobacterium sp. CG_23.4]